jgi:hypothetical protein
MSPISKNDAYKLIFQDFENPLFSRIDYCVYIESRTPAGEIDIQEYFAAGELSNYPISFTNGVSCGNPNPLANPIPITHTPSCDENQAEAIILTRPVLYQGSIANLKVLICAKRL